MTKTPALVALTPADADASPVVAAALSALHVSQVIAGHMDSRFPVHMAVTVGLMRAAR